MTHDPFNLGPLADCGIDDANAKLRKGYATRQHAENYVAAWNRPGHRLTEAYLIDHLVNESGIGMIAPFIKTR